jgi:hypothetical protein
MRGVLCEKNTINNDAKKFILNNFFLNSRWSVCAGNKTIWDNMLTYRPIAIENNLIFTFWDISIDKLFEFGGWERETPSNNSSAIKLNFCLCDYEKELYTWNNLFNKNKFNHIGYKSKNTRILNITKNLNNLNFELFLSTNINIKNILFDNDNIKVFFNFPYLKEIETGENSIEESKKLFKIILRTIISTFLFNTREFVIKSFMAYSKKNKSFSKNFIKNNILSKHSNNIIISNYVHRICFVCDLYLFDIKINEYIFALNNYLFSEIDKIINDKKTCKRSKKVLNLLSHKSIKFESIIINDLCKKINNSIDEFCEDKKNIKIIKDNGFSFFKIQINHNKSTQQSHYKINI